MPPPANEGPAPFRSYRACSGHRVNPLAKDKNPRERVRWTGMAERQNVNDYWDYRADRIRVVEASQAHVTPGPNHMYHMHK